MIELLKGFPDNVAAFAYHGHITKADYDKVLIPDFEDRLRRHKKLRIYFEIATDLDGIDPGAMWEDQKVGFSYFFDWERCAVVTDVGWAKHLMKFAEFFGFLYPGEYRAFTEAEAQKAREWIVEGQQSEEKNAKAKPVEGKAVPAKSAKAKHVGAKR
jgi:hypothetical protein